MTCVTAEKVREDFSSYVERAASGKERIVLKKRGKQVAALVPIEDLRAMEAAEDRVDIAEIEKAMEEVEEKGTVTLDELVKELGL